MRWRRASRTGRPPRTGWRRWRARAGPSALRIAGEQRWIAIEDAARYRDALGAALPVGVPAAFLAPVAGRARRARGALGAQPRAVPRRRAGAAMGGAGGPGRGGARAAAEAGTILRGEFRPGRHGARVVRPGRAAPAAAPLAGPPAARGRAGRAGRPGALPAGLAGRSVAVATAGAPGRCVPRPPWSDWRRSSISWRACRSRPRSSSATSCRPGSPATSRACWTSSGRSARWPGSGRGSLGRDDGRWCCTGPAARRCATSAAAARRPRRAATSTSDCATGSHDRGASFYRELLSAAGSAAGARRPGRAVGPGLGRRDHQRHVRAASGLALAAPDGRAAAAAGPAPAGAAGGGRAVVAGRGRRVGGRGRRAGRATAPPPTPRRPRPGSTPWHGPARAPRRADPRGRRGGGSGGRLQRRLPGPAGDGGVRADPPRLLRRRPRRGPVRPARRRGSAAVDARASAGRPQVRRPRRVHLLAAADPANPYGAALAWPRRGEADRRPLPARRRRLRRSWSTESPVLYLERGGHSLQTLPAADDPDVGAGRAARSSRAGRRRAPARAGR